jgi:hypothetical protein
MSWFELALIAWTVLLGTYNILQGIRRCSISGFRFYLAEGLINATPLLLLSASLVIIPGFALLCLFFVSLLWMIAGNWSNQQRQNVQKEYPSEWKERENTIDKTRRIDRILFYRGIQPYGKSNIGR